MTSDLAARVWCARDPQGNEKVHSRSGAPLARARVGARVLARHRRHRAGDESHLEADQMPQTHRRSTWQLKPMKETERALVANHLPRQDHRFTSRCELSAVATTSSRH